MRSVAELRKENDVSKIAADEAKKFKANVNKYKNELGKVKKDLKNKEKDLTKSNKNLEKGREGLGNFKGSSCKSLSRA